MTRAAWPDKRHPELPGIVGKRVLLCAFSAVSPLLPQAGLMRRSDVPFREICVNACLGAAAAVPDPDVRALVRDHAGISRRAESALSEYPNGARVWDWLHLTDGGWGGGDARGFWLDAVRWAGRTKPRCDSAALQVAVLDLCVPVVDAIGDKAWGSAVDTALKAPYDDADIAVSAHQGFGLLDGAAAGGDINVISVTLGPMRNWAILTDHWNRAPELLRDGLADLGRLYWAKQTALGWAEGSRIDDAWLDAPAHQAERVIGYAAA